MPIMKTYLSLVLILVFASCHKAPPPAARPPRPVSVAQATTRDVPLYIDEIGRCMPIARVMIQPQVSGLLMSVNFVDGAEVKKGDLLFSIDPRQFQVALDQAKSALTQQQAKSAYDLAQLQRNQKLSDRQVVAPQDLDSARSSELSSQAGLLAARAGVDSAAISLAYCSITSPIDGRASYRLADAGNIVTANTTNLLEIQTQDPIYVDFSVPESQLPDVRDHLAKGTLEVVASFPQDTKKSRAGTLIFMDSGVNKASGTVMLRGKFDNADRMFWPGQFVEVRIILETLPGAVLVPSEAIQTGADSFFVFVVNPDQTVSRRSVVPGQRQESFTVIQSGLAAGETVVVTGQLGLSDGSKVAPQPAPPIP